MPEKVEYYFDRHDEELWVDLCCLRCGAELHSGTMMDVTSFAANHRHSKPAEINKS